MSRIGTAVLLVAASLGIGVGSAQAQEEDPWLGPDKSLHFGVSAALALGGYGLGVALFDDPPPRLVLGGSVALGAGIAKELLDLATDGDASWRDLTWDLIGTATGLLIALGLDLLFSSGDSAARPAGQRAPP